MKHLTLFVLVICLTAAACKRAPAPPVGTPETKGGGTVTMKQQSTAFADGERIPKQFTCDGEDKSPPLSWYGIPEGAKSLALICDDPDAPMGTWVHWVLWGLPADAMSLPEGVKPDTKLPGDARQGLNSWPKLGYGGPCPPPGKPHRYFFKLYALDAVINPPGTPDKAALEKAMQGHVLAEAQLMGRYGR